MFNLPSKPHSLAVLLITLLLVGCTSNEPFLEQAGSTSENILSFEKYNDLGFLFSPAPPTGDYETKGIIDITSTPEIIEANYTDYQSDFMSNEDSTKTYTTHRIKYDYRNNMPVYKYFGVEVMQLTNILDDLYQRALKMDGNAIYDFDYSIRYQDKSGLPLKIISVSGTAVKIDKE